MHLAHWARGRFGAPIVAGCDAAPVLQPAEHDLDPIAATIAAPVVVDGLGARLPARNAGAYPLVFHSIPKPVGIISPVGNQPFSGRQAAQQGRGAGIVAYLTCGHEEAQRAARGVSDCVQLGVHATFGATDQTPSLVAGSAFFARRLEAVRCAFR